MTGEKRNGNGHNHTLPTDKRYAHVVGWGKYIPEKVMTNDDLAKIVDTSDEWIQQRTGIRERHIADPKETTSTMSVPMPTISIARSRFARWRDLSKITAGLYNPN